MDSRAASNDNKWFVNSAATITLAGLISQSAFFLLVILTSSLGYDIRFDPLTILSLIFIMTPVIFIIITTFTFSLVNPLPPDFKAKRSSHFSHLIWIGLGGILGEMLFWGILLDTVIKDPLQNFYFFTWIAIPLVFPLVFFIMFGLIFNSLVIRGYLDRLDFRFIIGWMIFNIIILSESRIYFYSIFPIIIMIFFIGKYFSIKTKNDSKDLP